MFIKLFAHRKCYGVLSNITVLEIFTTLYSRVFFPSPSASSQQVQFELGYLGAKEIQTVPELVCHSL